MSEQHETDVSRTPIWGYCLSAVALMLAVLTLVSVAAEWEQRRGTPITAALALLAAVIGLIAAMCIGVPRYWRQFLGLGAAGVAMLLGGFQCATLPAVCRVGESAKRATCKSNLRQIGLASHMYADDHEEEFPPNLESLVPDYIDNPSIFSCASADPRRRFGDKDLREAAAESHYAYVGAGPWAHCPGFVIMGYDKSLEHHRKQDTDGGRNVLFVDAHVEWWPASREAEFQEKLKKQREAVKKWRAAGAKKEDIGEFFGKLGEYPPKDATPSTPIAPWRDMLGQTVTVTGKAGDRALGAVVQTESGALWLDGVQTWPGEVRGKKVTVTGKLTSKQDLPVFVSRPGEPPRHGIPVPAGTDLKKASTRYLLQKPTWKVTGAARKKSE